MIVFMLTSVSIHGKSTSPKSSSTFLNEKVIILPSSNEIPTELTTLPITDKELIEATHFIARYSCYYTNSPQIKDNFQSLMPGLLTIISFPDTLNQGKWDSNLEAKEWLALSKAKKRTAWSMLGAGSASILLGAVLASSSMDISLDNSGSSSGKAEAAVGAILLITGLAIDIAAIVNFGSAARYKNRSLSINPMIAPQSNNVKHGDAMIPQLKIAYRF